MHLFFNISNLLMENSDNKCLKSVSSKFDVWESHEPLYNWIESTKMIFLLTNNTHIFFTCFITYLNINIIKII